MKYVDLGLPSGTLWANCNHNGYWNYDDSLMIGTIPTIEQWVELMNCCIWTWTKQKNTNGYKITSNKNGTNIFLPAAGFWNDIYFSNFNFHGYYWSSSVYVCDPFYANYVYFDSGAFEGDLCSRHFRYSIRLVKNI